MTRVQSQLDSMLKSNGRISAPVVSLVSPIFGFDRPTEQHKRFRKAGDLVSSLDNAAISYNTDSLNPIRNHDVDGLMNVNEDIPEMGWI